MVSVKSKIIATAAAAALVFAVQSVLEAVDVRVEYDKTFDFKPIRSWGWDPRGAGEVKMVRTQEDDPEAAKRKAEPWIIDAVTQEMGRLKLEQAMSVPDLTVAYYLLLSTNLSSQTMGQFLPAVAAWGLPPFPPATQSLKVMNRGSLVLDLSAKGTVVWRGLAQTELQPDTNDKKRETVIREGVRNMLRRYPRK
jgi:hypothetical protein